MSGKEMNSSEYSVNEVLAELFKCSNIEQQAEKIVACWDGENLQTFMDFKKRGKPLDAFWQQFFKR